MDKIREADDYISLTDLIENNEKKIEDLMAEQGKRHKSLEELEKKLTKHVGQNVPRAVIPIGDRAVLIEYHPDDGDGDMSTISIVRMITKK